MPIPSSVVRIVISGALPNGEEWSCGFYLESTGATTPAALATLAQTTANNLYAAGGAGGMLKVMQTLCNNQTTWVKTTAYAYPGGGTASSAVGEYVWPAAKTGALTNGVPSQCAVVLSLRTAHPGRSYRGRMYLPCTGAALQVDGQLTTTVASDLVNSFGASFSAMGSGVAGKAVVVSPKLDTYEQITSLIVDTKVDTMRSRAKSSSIDGTYHAAVT